MTGFGWVVTDDWNTGPEGWHFVLFDVHCRCGWFLAKASPVMGEHGVHGVEGECRRHGHVTAETWNIIDAGELE